MMRYDELARAMGAERVVVISKSLLQVVSIFESFYSFLFRKPRKLSREIVDSLTSASDYPTLPNHLELKQLDLEDFDKELSDLSQSYRTTYVGV